MKMGLAVIVGIIGAGLAVITLNHNNKNESIRSR